MRSSSHGSSGHGRASAAASASVVDVRQRAGKTSLFAHLRRHPERTVEYANLQRIRTEQLDADDLARLLRLSLRESSSPADTLRDALEAQDHPLVLLDEVGYLSRATFGLLGWLRDLGEEIACIVYAGSHGDWNQVIDPMCPSLAPPRGSSSSPRAGRLHSVSRSPANPCGLSRTRGDSITRENPVIPTG